MIVLGFSGPLTQKEEAGFVYFPRGLQQNIQNILVHFFLQANIKHISEGMQNAQFKAK